MSLKELNIYKESFPFDSISTTPALILKYLKNQDDFYPGKNIVITKDNVNFCHFDINSKYTETIETLKRRFMRLFDILQNNKKILFVYTSEADIYNEQNNRYNDNYNSLNEIVKYIIETYKYNKSFEDTENIINFTINVPDNYMSNDGSTRQTYIIYPYRRTLTNFLKEIFNKSASVKVNLN